MVSESVGELRISASGSCHSPTLLRSCRSGLICTFGVTVIDRSAGWLRVSRTIGNLKVAFVRRHDLAASPNRDISRRQ
jgi:hypothetical protein